MGKSFEWQWQWIFVHQLNSSESEPDTNIRIRVNGDTRLRQNIWLVKCCDVEILYNCQYQAFCKLLYHFVSHTSSLSGGEREKVSWLSECSCFSQESFWAEFFGIGPEVWARIEVEVVQDDHCSFLDLVSWGEEQKMYLLMRGELFRLLSLSKHCM